MSDYIYDIECYPNIFTVCVKQAHTVNMWLFEISTRRNNIVELAQFFDYLKQTNARMVGFNSLAYDYPMIHWLLCNYQNNITYADLYAHSSEIINTSFDDKFKWLIWDSDHYVTQIDLFKIHHFDNKSKFTSLKEIQFNRRSDSIEDLPFPPGTIIPTDQFDNLIKYNIHDVTETEGFYDESQDAIAFREKLSEKYGRNFLNHNDGKIGKDYFIMELEKSRPGCCYTKDEITGRRKPVQTIRPFIDLKDVILPYVSFKSPEFNRILDYFKNQRITETKGVFEDLNCTINGLKFVFGLGGIHASLENRIFKSDGEGDIIDVDVTSYYPSLAIVNRIFPAHMPESFCDIYTDVKNQRLNYPKKTPENLMLKLALNSVYGDSNNKFSPFYDPFFTMSITINGQLLLCMLTEYLMMIPGLTVIQANTDGVTVKCPKNQRANFKTVCEWWQKFTCLQLEEARYSRMFIRDVNSYIGEFEDGKLKRKGAYDYELAWHQNHSALVIPKAAEAALVRGEKMIDFITGHTDVLDFMLRTKVPRSSKLVSRLNGEDTVLQNVTRYYISRTGGELIKIMPPLAKKPGHLRLIGINKTWRTTEVNKLREIDRSTINYNYYVKETEKLVNKLRC